MDVITKKGYTKVRILEGGFWAWQDKGYPWVKGS
jgi:rhodanese-related sulfurtransferase